MAFHESGQFMSGGFGMVPLSWCEIESFCNKSMYDLTPWEATTLKRMSAAYVGEYNSTDPARVNPALEISSIDEDLINQKRVEVKNSWSSYKQSRKS